MAYTYALGAVKPYVKDAAYYFGPRHDFRTIYGWRAVGSVPNSDHPKGLALDFMTTSKPKGDELVADLLANASKWNITYVIWYRRIWKANTNAWTDYHGPVPHTDHVHVSFAANGASPAVQNVSNPLTGATDLLKQLSGAFQWVSDEHNWYRVGMFLIGFAMVTIAMVRVTVFSNAVKSAAKTVAKKVV